MWIATWVDAGVTQYASYTGPHPDAPAAVCRVTAWRKDDGVAEFKMLSPAVGWDHSTEVGVLVTVDCPPA